MSTMSADPRLTADIEAGRTSEEIHALLENAAVRSGIADRDPNTGHLTLPVQNLDMAAKDAAAKAAEIVAADQAVADAKAAAEAVGTTTSGFTRTENIGGKEFTFEAESELEIERMVSNAYRVAYAVQTPEARVAEVVVDPAAAQKAAEDDIVRKTDLKLKFVSGEISAADYLEQSGAIQEYLEKQGLSTETLHGALDSVEEQSWATATQEFLNGPVGKDWPGGERNLHLMGLKLQELGLENAKDKLAAFGQAYAAMKSTGMIFPYEEPVAAVPVAAVPVVAAVLPAAVVPAAVAPAPAAATSSSLFGASSGVGGGSGGGAPAVKTDVPADATPVQIIEAWKAAQLAGGKDPNAVFMESFSARRV